MARIVPREANDNIMFDRHKNVEKEPFVLPCFLLKQVKPEQIEGIQGSGLYGVHITASARGYIRSHQMVEAEYKGRLKG